MALRESSVALSGWRRSGLPLIFAAAALILLSWLGWGQVETRRALRSAGADAVRVAELRGVIEHLDEWLTMSARMAAATGETRWAERYAEAEPRLDAALEESLALAPPVLRERLAQTTADANRRLVAIERDALALAGAGRLESARALLDSDAYAADKAAYADGYGAFKAQLAALQAQRARMLDRRAWTEAAGLAFGATLLLIAAGAAVARSRLRRALTRTETVARTDALTGLGNRRALAERLDAALRPPKAEPLRAGGGPPLPPPSVGLLLLDLDRFKTVNDAHGHGAGDRLLQAAALRLTGAARIGDLVVRLGGDEFALLIEPATRGMSVEEMAEVAEAIARRCVAALADPFEVGPGLSACVGASVGVAVAPRDGRDADALLRAADVAMYHAKSGGRSRVCPYSPAMEERARRRAKLEAALRAAVGQDLLVPHFQPIVGLDPPRRLIGFEMLARWTDPVLGAVSPAEFIPVAEDAGLMSALTEGLLGRACQAFARWPGQATLAVNISAIQLRDRSLPATIRRVLDDSGLTAQRLEVELTEGALVADLTLAREVLGELRALGVRLALDDFGTGYSSLRHLRELPFDKIKIDASFVRAVATDAESRTIVAAVVGLAHSLGAVTVAEGVEDEAAAATLRELGCDQGQGWLFGRPMAAAAARELLQPAGRVRSIVRVA